MERSRGAVIFRKRDNVILYLILHYPSGHWDFVKGNLEEGESDVDTVKRESKEEAGLDVEIVPGFKERITYFYKKEGKTISKEVIFYVAKASNSRITLSYEHLGFKWLSFKEALELVTYKNSKDVLKKANDFLKTKGSIKDFLGR